MKVHILILNYNGAELLKKYIPSFVKALQASRHSCRLSIVDNQSRDDSRLAVSRFEWNVQWMPMNDNKVLCAYNDAARRLDDDILILMNNDIEVEEGFIDPLVEPFLTDKEVFFVTPKCLSRDRRSYEGNKTRARIRYGLYWSSALYEGYEKDMETLGPTIQGGFGAFDRKKFLQLGGYDDLYLPGRLEDADICFRAYKNGWKCLYQPKSIVHHEGGVSFNKVFGVRKTQVINWRNTYLFMWKNLSDRALLLKSFLWLPVRLLYSFLSFKPELFLGFLQALPLSAKALERRRKLKESGLLYAVPDNEIFNQV